MNTLGKQGNPGEPGQLIEGNFEDIETVTDGYLVLDADTIPVSVEINGVAYPVTCVIKNGETFKIPVAPILAAANLAEYSGTWRVWRAGGKQGIKGDTPVRGTDYWTADDISAIQAYCEEQIVNNAW